jgi:hypothetical protein
MKVKKHDIIKNLVEIPEGADRRFWQKEMVFLKKLEKRFSLGFLAQLVVESKVPTLAFYMAPWKQKLLENDFKEYYYNYLHSDMIALNEKSGEDVQFKTKKTIKNFLS